MAAVAIGADDTGLDITKRHANIQGKMKLPPGSSSSIVPGQDRACMKQCSIVTRWQTGLDSMISDGNHLMLTRLERHLQLIQHVGSAILLEGPPAELAAHNDHADQEQDEICCCARHHGNWPSYQEGVGMAHGAPVPLATVWLTIRNWRLGTCCFCPHVPDCDQAAPLKKRPTYEEQSSDHLLKHAQSASTSSNLFCSVHWKAISPGQRG